MTSAFGVCLGGHEPFVKFHRNQATITTVGLRSSPTIGIHSYVRIYDRWHIRTYSLYMQPRYFFIIFLIKFPNLDNLVCLDCWLFCNSLLNSIYSYTGRCMNTVKYSWINSKLIDLFNLIKLPDNLLFMWL